MNQDNSGCLGAAVILIAALAVVLLPLFIWHAGPGTALVYGHRLPQDGLAGDFHIFADWKFWVAEPIWLAVLALLAWAVIRHHGKGNT
jgi:hypothetical protein